ncbi:MAG: hypothetical protein IJT83_15760 [Victivallales bacterium]|nr:hypothetical protein [Victivallales bacterium]
MRIQLSDHFGYRRLLVFTLPSIATMLFTSIYGIVDGYFVSNFAGKSAFSGLNFAMPMVMILSTLGFMLGTGGSALIGKLLGEQNRKHANELFSMLVYVTVLAGVLCSVLGMALIRPLCGWLGADGDMLREAVIYGRVCLAGLPMFMLQIEFQTFFILGEKPRLGLATTLLSGCSNMALDALLVGMFRWGVAGAAVATVASQTIGAVLPLVYFLRPNDSLLRLGSMRWYPKDLLKVCLNGSSEMMSSVAMSFVGTIYNVQLLKYEGENGVAAYGTLMYVNFVFLACFIGYSVGVAPVISYHFGAHNHAELKNLLRRSLSLIAVTAVFMFLAGEILAVPLARLFASYDQGLLALTRHAFAIFSFSFLFVGVPIFGSAFFTALNDGLTSALISFLRTMLFELVCVLALPLVWGTDGIWASMVVAEITAFAVTLCFLLGKRRKYKYI